MLAIIGHFDFMCRSLPVRRVDAGDRRNSGYTAVSRSRPDAARVMDGHFSERCIGEDLFLGFKMVIYIRLWCVINTAEEGSISACLDLFTCSYTHRLARCLARRHLLKTETFLERYGPTSGVCLDRLVL